MVNTDIRNILFLDIETVPSADNFDNLSPRMKEFWDKKSTFFRKENETAKDVYNRAGIYAEFGKIICISAGYIILKNDEKIFRIKSFAGSDEKIILIEFKSVLEKFYKGKIKNLCAHNGKEFDFPYIARRLLINNLSLPKILDVGGKKPWEVPFLDTMEMWRFGDYKNYTSLDLLAELFQIPSPKNDMDGSMVAKVFWIEKDINRIKTYCENDTLTVAQLFLKYRGEKLIKLENVEQAN